MYTGMINSKIVLVKAKQQFLIALQNNVENGSFAQYEQMIHFPQRFQ